VQRPKLRLVILQRWFAGFWAPGEQTEEVPVVAQRLFLKQVVLPFPQTAPLRTNLQLTLQQDAPLKREMMRPLLKRTPGSHCSVPSTTPLPQTPGTRGVWLRELPTGMVFEAEIPEDGVFEGDPPVLVDWEAPVENEADAEPAPEADWEAPVENDPEGEVAPEADCEAPVENEPEREPSWELD